MEFNVSCERLGSKKKKTHRDDTVDEKRKNIFANTPRRLLTTRCT